MSFCFCFALEYLSMNFETLPSPLHSFMIHHLTCILSPNCFPVLCCILHNQFSCSYRAIQDCFSHHLTDCWFTFSGTRWSFDWCRHSSLLLNWTFLFLLFDLHFFTLPFHIKSNFRSTAHCMDKHLLNVFLHSSWLENTGNTNRFKSFL